MPIKIVGYWGGTTAEDPSVMGTITLADEHGKNQRSFGVTQVQSFDPPNAMMDVFQPSKLKPAIIVYGRASETSVLFGAKDKEKVTVLGIYWANRGNLIVSSVKPVAETN